MEVLFENNLELTKELYVKFAQKNYVKFRKKYRAFVLTAFIATFVLMLFSLSFKGFLWFTVFTLAACAFFAFMYFKAYVLYAGKGYKTMMDLHGGTPQITTLFYQDKIDVKTPRSMLTIYYDQITSIIETEQLYIPMVNRQGIMLKKDGFIVGDYEAFKSFIKEKCSNLK